MYHAIINVKPLTDYKLLVTFKNNELRILDMAPYLNKGIYNQLSDLKIFNSVHISFDTIEWPNGVDLDPEFIYSESLPFEPRNLISNA